MRRSLTRDERLRKSRDIRELFSTAPRVDARGMRLLFRVNGGPATRFAVVVGRGCGGAVSRNKEKRLTREAYRALKESVPVGRDLLFVVGRFGMTLVERQAAMAQLLVRAGLKNGLKRQ